MMNTRVKIICDETESFGLDKILIEKQYSVSTLVDLEEACESQETDPADVFVLGQSFYFQTHLNQIQKLPNSPAVVLYAGPRIPNLARILMPRVVFSDWEADAIVWSIEQAIEENRKEKRLLALREHHQRSWGLESNPAINLVTGLMRKCTLAEEYKDILASVKHLKSSIDYQDASIIILNSEGQPLEGWHSSKESKDRLLPLAVTFSNNDLSTLQKEGEVVVFSSSDPTSLKWDDYTRHPWSFSLAIRFSLPHGPKGSKSVRSAVLLLFRRELLPFQDRDLWLIEATYGPLALALEKVAILKAIGQASKEWRSTFDGISEPLTVIDANYHIVKANRAFAQLVDQDIKKLKGKRCFTLLANRRTPCFGCPVGSSAGSSSGSRIQFQGKQKKDLLAWSYGIRTGLESYHFQFYRNVSKETALSSALIQSEKMAALGRLVGAVAHEINNPLAGILATSQILLSDSNDSHISHEQKSDLEEIRSAAWRSKKIIDDLLGFTNGTESKNEETDLGDAIRSALTFSKSALAGVRIELNIPNTPCPSPVALNSLQQVLFNLFTNAAHAMNGSGSLLITLDLNASSYRLEIKDTGPGINAETLKHIFDPFYTSKKEGTGTGLGLSIVRNLIQRMGAKIEVQSTVGKGTIFYLTLPRPKE